MLFLLLKMGYMVKWVTCFVVTKFNGGQEGSEKFWSECGKRKGGDPHVIALAL